MHVLALLAVLVPLVLVTQAAAVTVPGRSNPNLAGRALSYTCCNGDAVPLESPVPVGGVPFLSCDLLEFSVTGAVSYTPSVPSGNNPDGDEVFSMTTYGDGISAPLDVRVNALLGVFLGDDSPTGASTPGPIDYDSTFGFSQFSPAIGQIFFIGDGRTTDTNAGQFGGAKQSFVVPPGATRLFLGTSDGEGWFNNTGSFDVEAGLAPGSAGGICGDPLTPEGVATNDALYVLRSAVGSVSCEDCLCDADGSGGISATDALRVLRVAVGGDDVLLCSCCTTA